MRRPSKSLMADTADRHYLYQESVQDTEAEIDFVQQTWDSLRDRPAEYLREDFCGTANTACEWIRRDHQHYAVGIDMDSEVLQWGWSNNIAQLDPQQRARISLLRENVISAETELADIVLAMNFSYYLFTERSDLLDYFRCVHAGLVEDGIFFLDAYGGYDAPKELEEPRDCEGFTYIWEQASFNPIDSCMTCHIHFEFPDDSRMENAFTYHWRLWTLPELTELLSEAGFRQVEVYWEGTDEETNEGDGVFEPATVGDADPGWVCYIVAER
jgi:hypothetical protein